MGIFVRRSGVVDMKPMHPSIYCSAIPRKSVPPLIPAYDTIIKHMRPNPNGNNNGLVRCSLNACIRKSSCARVSLRHDEE